MNRDVIFIDETAQIGGAEINLLNVIGLLQDRGWTPSVVLPESGPLADRLVAEGIRVHYVPHPRFFTTSLYLNNTTRIPNPFGLFLSLFAGLVWTFRLAGFLRSHPGTVIQTISTWAHGAGSAAARFAGLPAVWHFQEIVNPQAGWGLYNKMVLFAARWLPERIVCISELVAEPFRDDPKIQHKVVLLWNTIDTRRFAPAAGSADQQAHESLNIITVARLTPWKGQEIILEVAHRLYEKRVPFRWILVGDESLGVPGYAAYLRDLMRERDLNGYVQMMGWVNDVPTLYQDQHVLVHIPVEPEPFGLVLAEALSVGLPVITTSHGGAAQLVADAGGVIVPPGEPQPVFEKLCHWWEAPEERRRVGFAARRYAEQTFGLDNYVNDLVTVYTELF